METKFNFKSQICTTREQSERLLALGLKKETADIVHYFSQSLAQDWTIVPLADGETARYIQGLEIPAWSLHRLLSMLPDNAPKIYWILDGANISIEIEDEGTDFFPHKGDIYKSVVDCIERLIKEGIFNKEYLEETL